MPMGARDGRRLAVVTGATGGIGGAVARALLREGWTVVGSGRDQDALARLADGGVVPLTLEVTDAGSVESFAAAVLDGHGVPDLLVNNAGIGLFRRWEDTSPDDLERLLAVDLVGAARVDRAFLPAMVERGSGLLVHVASVAGLRGFPEQTAYCAAKHGLLGWSRALAFELDGTGVRVVDVCPPAIDTDFFARAGLPDFRERHPWVRALPPEDVAEAVLDAVRRPGRREIVVGRRARLVGALERVAPGLRRALRRRAGRGR